ncbi:hypothetical protein ZTR_06446 [Talaromyces verruculosus]|nr:hypothetical protein ZTR_06446 [Talaromyces verruculosus]
MSSDTMLSGFGDVGEEDIFPEQNGPRSRAQSNTEDKAISDSVVHGPGIQPYSIQNFDNIERDISAYPPENDVHIRSSPIPVLHRFTLDDQVLAEQLANSQREAESSGSHRSGHNSALLSHGSFKNRDTFDKDIFLDFSPGIKSDDRHTNLSGPHKSYPTDSDTLPQTQKIQRRLLPSQSQMAQKLFSEAQFKTPRVTSRLTTRPESVVNTTEPMTLFGQKVQPSPPKSSNRDVDSITSERPIQSSIHGYHMASPRVPPVSTPRAVNQTSELNSVTRAHSTSGFRFPNLWTPHRTIPQLSSYETRQRVDIPTSPVLISQRGPSPFISTLSQRDNITRQPPFSARKSLGMILEDTKVGGHEGIHAPVFNTPFRR